MFQIPLKLDNYFKKIKKKKNKNFQVKIKLKIIISKATTPIDNQSKILKNYH